MAARIRLLIVIFILAGCAPAPSAPTTSPLPLHTLDPAVNLKNRPVQLLKLEPGTQCPRAHPRQVNLDFGPAIGDGPAYAAGFDGNGILNISFPAGTETPFYGSEWSGAKVLWIVDPVYRGPLLIRGGRMDGSGQVRFENGSEPPSELWLPSPTAPSSTTSGWRSFPSYTRLRSPGCYMYQVDGLTFTETIIFEAKATP